MVKLSADQRRFHQAAESDNVSSEKLKEIIEKIVNSRDDLGSQSFTSLMVYLHQDINRVSSYSRCLNGTFP